MYHGNISPQNYILTKSNKNRYKLINFFGLYVYDFEEKDVYFVRNIEPSERFFVAPEVLKYYEV